MADRVYLGEATMPVVIDEALDSSSTNPVQNKVVTQALAGKEATISDLATIRSGAALGATSIQPSDVTSVYSPTGTAPLNGVAVDSALSSTVGNPLFYYTFADHLFSNTNWLRADTFSWQDGSVYTSAYQHLVDDIAGKTSETETIGSITITFYRATDGHKICLANQAGYVSDLYDATGVAWYYILDTANTRFKLPRMLPLGDTAPVIGNGQTLGLYTMNGTTRSNGGLYEDQNNQLCVATGLYGTNVGTTYSGSSFPDNKGIGVTDDSTKSGLIADLSHTSNDGAYKYLYFYCGNTVQSQTTIDVGQITEALNGKADTDLGNVSATGKETAVGWGMPDYSAGISVSGNGFTASADGIWYVLAYNTSAFFSYIVVNNITTACGISGTSGYQDQSAIAIYLSKGDVVTWSANPSSISSSTFYPLKGAN